MPSASVPTELVQPLTATPLHPAVVLGADVSDTGYAAARWAAREARERATTLVVVRVYTWNLVEPWRGWDRQIEADIRKNARQFAEDVAEHAEKAEPGVRVIAKPVEGYPAHVLEDASEHAGLIVVGNDHRGPMAGVVLGSVAGPVAGRASCPVVVVSGPGTLPGERGCVVVGVSGGPESERVLAYAFDRASRAALPLHAVLCWPPDPRATAMWRPEPPAPDKAERWLHESIAGWRERYPDVVAVAAVVRDHPAAGLAAAALGAELLVVGRHGHHARGWLGSVSQAVLHRATVPVAVVPTD